MTSIGELTATLSLDTSGFERSVKNATSSLDKVSDKMGAVGKKMTAFVTLPILGAGGAILNTAKNFETGMNEIRARTGATAEEMEMMREKALQMGEDTVFSAQDAAEAFLELVTSGASVSEAMVQIDSVMAGAAASGSELGFTADALTDIMASFDVEVGKSNEVMQTLIDATGSSSAKFGLLAEGFANVGPIAKDFGISIEETAATLAVFSESGIKGAEGGTQLRSMLNNLTRDTERTRSAWSDLGTDWKDSEGNIKDLDTIIADITEGMDGMSEAAKTQITKDLAGTYGQMGLSALIGAEGIDKMQKKMSQQSDVADVADARMEGLAGKMEDLSGSLETLAITIADSGLLDFITDLIGHITNFVDWLGNANKTTQVAALIFAGFAAALGPLLVVVSTLINVFTVIGPIIAAIGAGPIAAIVVAIAAFIAIIVLLIKHWDKVKEVIGNVVNWIVNFLRNNYTAILTVFFGPLGYLIATLIKNIDHIRDAFVNLFNKSKPILNNMKDFFMGVVNGIVDGISSIVSLTSNLGGTFGRAIKDFLNNNIVDQINNAKIEVLGQTVNFPDVLPRFEKGGIVGGGSFSGDNMLIRANSGEEVVTRDDRQTIKDFIANLSQPESKGAPIINIYNKFDNSFKPEDVSRAIQRQIQLNL